MPLIHLLWIDVCSNSSTKIIWQPVIRANVEMIIEDARGFEDGGGFIT
jgi:hypothetical protein